MTPEQLAAIEPKSNDKAGQYIERHRTKMQMAMEIAPEMKGRYVKNRNTGNIFGWTPHFHLHPDMEVLPEGFVPDHIKAHTEAVKARTAAKVLKDKFDGMSMDELRDEAKAREISLGRLKDVDKIKEKLRAWDTLHDGPPAGE